MIDQFKAASPPVRSLTVQTLGACAPRPDGTAITVLRTLDSPEDLARAKQGWPRQMARYADRKNRAFYNMHLGGCQGTGKVDAPAMNRHNSHICKEFHNCTCLDAVERRGLYFEKIADSRRHAANRQDSCMQRHQVALVTAFASALTLAVTAGPHAQSVERQLVVSVLDDDGEPVAGLQPADFVVREDDVIREVLRVSQDTGAREIAVLVDTSRSASNVVTDFRRGLSAFVEAMHDGNRISIIGYGGPPRILVESTTALPRLQAGVDRIFAYGSSAAYLLDAMSEAAEGFLQREAARPVMVVLTTEGLDLSHIDARSVLRDLDRAAISLYPVVLTESTFNRGADLENLGGPLAQWRTERDLALNQGAPASGGRRRDLLTSMGVEQAMRETAAELRSQYLVVYARPNTLIPPREIAVSVTREGMEARGTPVNIGQ